MASTEDSGDRDSQAAQSREHGIESARKRASWLLQYARRCGSNHWRPETHGDKTGAGKRRPRPPAAQVQASRRKCVQAWRQSPYPVTLKESLRIHHMTSSLDNSAGEKFQLLVDLMA